MGLFRSLTYRVKQLFGLESPEPEVQAPEVPPIIDPPDETPSSKSNRQKFVQAEGMKAKTNNPVSEKCPHGKRREYCPICDPKGYKFHFGDWRSD